MSSDPRAPATALAQAPCTEPADPAFDLARIVAELHQVRAAWRSAQQRNEDVCGRELPSPAAMSEIVQALTSALFPSRQGPPCLRQESEDYHVGHTLDAALQALRVQVQRELRHAASEPPQAGAVPHADAATPQMQASDARALAIVREFGALLPQVRRLLDTDVLAAFHGDPAARSVDEVLLCYPGFQAMVHHRLAHPLYRLGVPLLARMVAEMAHSATGIDIHPGAQIGAGFFIDHGTGVVIGETAVIGCNVRLYQAVTLGAKHFETDAAGHVQKGGARHPIVEDDVVVYAGATILGRVTIGRGSTIGGNVWLTHSVPPGSHITQALILETGANDDAKRSRSGPA